MKGLAALVAVALAFGPREGVAFAPAGRVCPAPRGAVTMGLFDSMMQDLSAIGSAPAAAGSAVVKSSRAFGDALSSMGAASPSGWGGASEVGREGYGYEQRAEARDYLSSVQPPAPHSMAPMEELTSLAVVCVWQSWVRPAAQAHPRPIPWPPWK